MLNSALRLLLAIAALLLAPASALAQDAARPNLAHLDFLGEQVAPPAQAGHTTWRLEQEPAVGMLWTYADRNADGSYRRIGGGPYDAATDTYGQGAFNADDISRAAVVYLRYHRRHHDAHSRRAAYELLRGLAYMQTASGPNAGNVVLWMQPDGTFNPSPEPVELPDPSDSAESYWLARTVWALGEGYREFKYVDPAFARFLRARLDLSVAALERQVLVALRRDEGRRRSVGAGVADRRRRRRHRRGDARPRRLRRRRRRRRRPAGRSTRFGEGVARMGSGSPRAWPYGAVLPWALSRSIWHAWASQMPAALAATGRRDLLAPAIADSASFTSHLLVAGGADNGWQPSPTDRTQIAYGADSRIQSLLAVADASRRPGLRRLAGVAATFYFGNNAAGAVVYDAATGRTFDGVSGDGVVNQNSGAESTIHGLLSMIALEGAPDAARWSQVSAVASRETWRVAEAEDGVLSGGASIVTPSSSWTGESAWSGGAYVSLPAGARVAFGSASDSLIQPVAWRTEGSGGGRTAWTAGARSLGTLSHENAGAQGASEVPGFLEVSTLPGVLRAGSFSAARDARHRVARRRADPAAARARRAPARGARPRPWCAASTPGPARRRSTFRAPGPRACRPTTPAAGSPAARRSGARGCAPACSPAASRSPSASGCPAATRPRPGRARPTSGRARRRAAPRCAPSPAGAPAARRDGRARATRASPARGCARGA